MTKIPGKIEEVIKKVEIGAEWIADDGTKFNSEYECQQYEQKIAKKSEDEKQQSIFEKFKDKFYSAPSLWLTTGTDDGDIEYKLMKYNTADDFIKDHKAISYDYYHRYMSGSINNSYDPQTFMDNLGNIKFPVYMLCNYRQEDTGDYGCGEEYHYDFLDVESYKKNLLDNIVKIDGAIKEASNG